jgi:hypothetical protein
VKTWNFFKANAPLILLPLVLVKAAIIPHPVDFASIICLALLLGFFKFQDDNKEEPANADIRRDIEGLRNELRESRDKIDKVFLQQSLKR